MSEGKTLRIEAGKYYRTRAGRKVGPMSVTPDRRVWNWEVAVVCDGKGWYDGGSYTKPALEAHDMDLIAEWSEAPIPPGHVRLASGEVVDLIANRIAHGLLEPEVRAAMMAHPGPFDWWSYRGDWVSIEHRPSWDKGIVYRVRPVPVVQTPREWWVIDHDRRPSFAFLREETAQDEAAAYGGTVVHVREVIGGAA